MVTDDYRGFRKGVYVRVTEVNPRLETGLSIRALFLLPCATFGETRRVPGALPASRRSDQQDDPCPPRHVVFPARRLSRLLPPKTPAESIAFRLAPAVPLLCHLRHAQGGDEMGTTWNASQDENKSKSNTGRLAPPRKEVARLGRCAASVWTRGDKIGVVACFALLGVLLVISACSKQEQTSATVNATNATASAASSIPLAELPGTGTVAASAHAATPASPKKSRRKLAANVKYSDANSGVSFMYPRKAALASEDKNQGAANTDVDILPMNFVQSGGMAVATVALPRTQYPGTDFSAALFRVNVNRSVSADECPHFAFVDSSDADGEAIDAQKVKVGATDMEMISEFAGSAARQVETRYYHAYENGGCYEYVLGLSTAGFGEAGVHAVDRDQVFARLEKILASAKIRSVDEEQVARQQSAPQQEVSKQDDQMQELPKHDSANESAANQSAAKQNAQAQLAQKPEPQKETSEQAAAPEPQK